LRPWQKRARQLLLNPAGRAALKEYGIDVEIAKPDAKAEDKPIVVILCPTYRSPEPKMGAALLKMVSYTRERDKAIVYEGPPISGSVVHWSRNWLITEHIKTGKPWTHCLFIDDDIVIEPDTLERLLSHKKDIVAGLCTRRNDPPIPNIRFFDRKTGESKQVWEWPEGKLIEVDAVGTGLMLISRQALEQVSQVYFDCLWEKDFYGLTGEKLEYLKSARLKKFDADKTCYWFRFLPTPQGDIEMGEDVTFCQLAKNYCDIPIHVDTSVQPGHLGIYPYSIKDFEPYRDECILRAKIKGEYPMEVPPMKISILCPTRGRPGNVKRLIDSVIATATVCPEFVFYVDDDDETFPQAIELPEVRVLRGPRITLSAMWDKCAEVATGEILMQAGDDIVFRTPGWDGQVRRAFASFPDRLAFVHGDDGIYGHKFGTHGFMHRAWKDATGYFVPPYFSSDMADVWLNDLANMVNRRVFLPFITEHMHFINGKASVDKTHQERMDRGGRDNVKKLYDDLLPERLKDAEKLRRSLGKPYEMVHLNPDPAIETRVSDEAQECATATD
jgi:glycosyltransferase involved in cell wall biosynthesis